MLRGRARLHHVGSTESGFTFIELAAAATVLVIATMALMMDLTVQQISVELKRETAVATQAARAQLEQIRDYQNNPNATFANTFAAFNTTPADDPVVAPGANFTIDNNGDDVPDLEAQNGDLDGFVGRIILPEDPNDATRLIETSTVFGLNVDLDGDGVDAQNHAADYIVLPVRVRVEWRSINGQEKFVELSSMIVAP